MKQDIVTAMPMIKVLDKNPKAFIPSQYRPPLRRIVDAMKGQPDDAVVREWCERQLRK